MRLLIASFYFPPAGGAGVQRPLKFAEELARAGVDVHVLAPDDPRWIHRDEELSIAPTVSVHRAGYLGPRGRRPADELHGLRGLERFVRQVELGPRRLLLPDENVTWLATALPAAIRLIRSEAIDVVLTTSPPTSVHLVGAVSRRLTRARWVADLRDSIVAKEDRRVERIGARLKEKSNVPIARSVARNADAIVAVTETFANEMRELGARGPIFTIPNGSDFDEFEGLSYQPGERFRITHTGSFFGQRSAGSFLEALRGSDPAIIARFAGDFRRSERELLDRYQLGGRVELLGFVPRRRSLALQRDSEALLLLLPEIGGRGKDVPSGKLYEYLAAERPILAAVPQDGTAAGLIEATGAGTVVAPDNVEAMTAELNRLASQWRSGTLAAPKLSLEWKEKLSRTSRASDLLAVLAEVTGQPRRGR